MPAIMFLAMLVAPWRTDPEPASMRWPLRTGGIGLAALAMLTVGSPSRRRPLPGAELQTARDPKQAPGVRGKRAREYNPFDTRLAQREAEVAAFAGEWDRAEEARKQAIRLNPEHYAPYFLMAEFYEARGQTKEAREYYEKALALNPLDPELRQKVKRSGGNVGAPRERGRTPQRSGDQTSVNTPFSPRGSVAQRHGRDADPMPHLSRGPRS